MIKSVGSFNEMIGSYKANDWAKKAEIGSDITNTVDRELSMNDVQPKEVSFKDLMANSLLEVNQLQKDADKAIQKLVTGESKSLDETMMAVEKADIAFRAMNQVRMKVIDAYREIMKMQV